MRAPSPQAIVTMRPAISAGWFYVPYEAVGTDAHMHRLKKRLSHTNRDTGNVIRMFKDLPSQGMIGVPRAFGLAEWPWLPFEDHTTIGEPMIDPVVRLPSPHHPSVKEPLLQAAFMHDMEVATHEHMNFIAYATTGSGKTVVGSRNAALLGRKTAIFVPLEKLMDQWYRELQDKLGVPEHRIGIVQSDTCQFADRDYVICMMKSLGVRRYPSDFYASIGHVLVDECHRIATAELAMTTALFSARYRIGLSATPENKSGSDKVIFWHIGPMKVRSEASAVDCDVYTWEYNDNGRMAAIPPLIQREGEPRKSEHGFRIKKLTEDETRNQALARLVVRLWKARKGDEGVLAIGEHVGHVQRIMELCAEMGVPASAMGQCTGERHTYKTSIRAGTLVRTLTGKKKISQADFNRAKENAEIVFATYGCFKEGIDERRLASGIDLSPQAKAKQVLGRTRRPYEGKLKAVWITPVDIGDYMSMRYYKNRMSEYNADANVRVIHGRIR